MKSLICLIGVLLLTLLSGCSMVGFSNQKDVYMFLIDKSGSTTEVAERNQKTFVEKKISQVPAGATIVAIAITANPLAADRNTLIRSDLPATHWWKFHEDGKINREKQKFTDDTEQMLQNTPVAQGTAILDTLRLAESALPRDGDSKVTIIIVSDMMEVSPRLDMYQACSTLDEQKIATFIRAEQDAGRLAKLSGATVEVVGAGIGNVPMDVSCRDATANFWHKLIEAEGGSITEYDPFPISQP